ncbi:hypothetical protein Pmani_000611 [Petrolisthes manimaculis]|uniref:HTH psq-type domain-containing protein n=1 Tax=Petrolisthes manimaculis TaxID=1843537 RepID=A0AAE1QLR1_9EUCA|nr:hypothetical protein Pmani_000611 [Petrolisthes manimaculis]
MAPKEKKKHVHLSIADKLELLKKLEAGASVSRVCEIYGVKKQTVSDIRKAKDKLRNYALKFNVDPTKDKKGVIHGRNHMRQPQSETLEEAVFKWYVQQRSVKVLSTEEIAEAVLVGKQSDDSRSSDEEKEVAIKPKMSLVRESIDILLNYVDLCDNYNIQGYYEHLRTLRELVIREQHKRGKQTKLDTFFKRKTPEPQPSTSKDSSVAPTSASDFVGFTTEPQPTTSKDSSVAPTSASDFVGFTTEPQPSTSKDSSVAPTSASDFVGFTTEPQPTTSKGSSVAPTSASDFVGFTTEPQPTTSKGSSVAPTSASDFIGISSPHKVNNI